MCFKIFIFIAVNTNLRFRDIFFSICHFVDSRLAQSKDGYSKLGHTEILTVSIRTSERLTAVNRSSVNSDTAVQYRSELTVLSVKEISFNRKLSVNFID